MTKNSPRNLLISDHIGLHIRAVGEWTNRLLNFFEKEQEKLHNGEVAAYIPGTSGDGMQISQVIIEDESESMMNKMGREMAHADAINKIRK